jgi:HK97 family phage major capsid protein
MSKSKYHELITAVGDKTKRVNELFDAADRRGDGVNTAAEISEIKSLNKSIEEMQAQAAELAEGLAIRAKNDQRMKDIGSPAQSPAMPNGGPGDGPSAQPYDQRRAIKTIGEFVMEDPAFKQWWDQMSANGGLVGGNRKFDSPPVSIKSLLTGAGSTSGGPLVFPDFKPIVDLSYQRPLTVRDIITIGSTDGDTVEYVRVTGVTNNAAPTAEATATGDGTGAKPESAMALLRVAETVKTIAHWIPATNRALADAGQLRTLIDSFLRYGLEEELEDQIITGSGSGENFTGVLQLAGTTAQAFDTDKLTTTRKARTKVRVTGRAIPTAWVMHPNDWEAIDLLQDNEGRYYYGGPAKPGQPMLWGLPVVESEAMTEGYTVVADWKLCVLWDRLQTAISMTNSHSDFFIRNLVAILAEMRAALGWLRPKAFVVTDLTA